MSDKIFRSLLLVSALILLLIFAGMFFSLSKGAVPAFREFGFFGFIFRISGFPEQARALNNTVPWLSLRGP